MSCEEIKVLIDQAMEDQIVTQAEGEAICSREDSWFGGPPAIGTYLDTCEELQLNSLYDQIIRGNIRTESSLKVVDPRGMLYGELRYGAWYNQDILVGKSGMAMLGSGIIGCVGGLIFGGPELALLTTPVALISGALISAIIFRIGIEFHLDD